MTIKLGIHTNCFKDFSLYHCIKRLSELGYEGIELCAKYRHLSPHDSYFKVADIKALLKEYDMDIYALSMHLDFLTPNQDHYRENIRKIKKVINFARKFGVSKVITAPGYRHKGMSEGEVRRRFFQAMKEIGEYANTVESPVFIVLEPEPEKYLTPMAVNAIEMLQPPIFKICLDLRHFYCSGGVSFIKFLENDERIGHIHVDDVDTCHSKQKVPLGEGKIDFKEFFACLKRKKYNDYLSVELNENPIFFEDPFFYAKGAIKFLKGFL